MNRSALLLIVAASAGVGAQPAKRVPLIEKYFSLVRAEYSGDKARELVAFMDGKSRWPGNTAFDASLDRVVSQLRAAGYVLEDSGKPAPLTYRIEKRPLRAGALAWDLNDASLTIVGDRSPLLTKSTNLNMVAINSYPTPDSGVVGDLIDIKTGNADIGLLDLTGKIVLVEGNIDRTFTQVVRRGALGVLAYSQPAYNKPAVNRSVISFRSITLDTVHKAWAMPISRNALDTLRARLAKGPVKLRAIVKTRLFPSADRTVIAEVRGSERPNERFVFSAHVQEPGTNDNASGVGTLAEIARVLAVLSKNGSAKPRRTITMLFGTEVSQTRNYLADDRVRAAGVHWGLSMDMTGEDTKKTGGTFLIEKMPDPSAVWTRGDDHHTEWGGRPMGKDEIVPHYFNDFLLSRALEQAATNGWIVRTNPYEGGSDHSPFLAAKVPGVLFWHFTDQFYHTDGDRIDKVSAPELANCGITALVSALTLTTADGEAARAIIAQLERSAINRLDTELRLSKSAVSAGADVSGESEILQSWTDYYVSALATTADIEVGGASAQTLLAINDAKSRVAAAGSARVAQLKP